MRAASLIAALVGLGACGDSSPTVPPLTSVDGIPIIPVGYDAYRHLEELPSIRILDRAYMRSTYDRTGGNEAADCCHFIRHELDGTYTTLDVAGAGMLVFSRANRWHGSPWHVVSDGVDHVVQESSTATPTEPVQSSIFLPAKALPAPLAITWSETNGADLNWVPAPFTSSLRLSDERTYYGTGYYIYHSYPLGADHLSMPLVAWDEKPPPEDVLDLLSRAGTDIAPSGDDHGWNVDVRAGATTEVDTLRGPAVIRRLAIDAPASAALALANVRLQITWDERDAPSVDAPIGWLFAGGTLYNRDRRKVLVAGLLANVTFDRGRVRLALYFPMPFRRSARVALVGQDVAVDDVHVAIRTRADAAPAGRQGYFHATYVDHGLPTPGNDLVLLDTTAVEGGGDWCGSFVGTSFTFSDVANLGTLEGDPRFFFDDARSPQGYGTGTEEWAGGGDYWGGATVTLPLAGHPTGAPSLALAHDETDAIESAYRFLIADAMPFGKNARIQLEHGGHNDSIERYRTVVYWYGYPSACLVATDSLHVGDPVDEAGHGYSSPTASAPVSITSRWDALGVDAENPEETDIGRTMTGVTTLTLSIDPDNRGVLLRRKLDHAYVDQRAEVFVADDAGVFQPAGVWYLAGSTTSVLSAPPNELDPGMNIVQVSNRRFREDEFLIPRTLTKGRSQLTIQLRFVPSALPLYPGAAVGETAWSEIRYTAYSYVLPTNGSRAQNPQM